MSADRGDQRLLSRPGGAGDRVPAAADQLSLLTTATRMGTAQRDANDLEGPIE